MTDTYKPLTYKEALEKIHEIVCDNSSHRQIALNKIWSIASEALAKEPDDDILKRPLFLKENEKYCDKCNGTGVVAKEDEGKGSFPTHDELVETFGQPPKEDTGKSWEDVMKDDFQVPNHVKLDHPYKEEVDKEGEQ